MSTSWFSRIQKCFSKRAFSATRPRAKYFRPEVQDLEERSLMSSLFVVPMSDPTDAANFHTLTAAVAAAHSGDFIDIDPGTTPDSGPVNINVPNLTIQTENFAFDPRELSSYDIDLNANNITLGGLNLGVVRAASTVNNESIGSCFLVSFTELGATSGVGHNILENCVITGFVDLQGNSGQFLPTEDDIENNSFTTSAAVALKLTNSNFTVVQGNRITDNAPAGIFAIGIAVYSNSNQVLIKNNHVQMTSSISDLGLDLANTNGTGSGLGARLIDNSFDTGGQGTGMLANIYGNGDGMAVLVQGNDFHANLLGILINGVSGPTGAGHIDLGGGSAIFGSSLGGNSFRSFDGVAGHYSIQMINTDPGVTVSAEKNYFSSGILPHATVADGVVHNGSGVVNVTAMQPKDLLGQVSSSGELWAAQSTGSSFSNQYWGPLAPSANWVDVQTGDFIGNGQTDIVARNLQTGEWRMAPLNGGPNAFNLYLWGQWNPKVTWVDVKIGDFNGDGRDDIAGRVLQTGQWWVAESTGSGFTNSLWTTWNPNVTWVDVNVANFDGKVKQDIVGRVLQTGQWWVGLSTGSSFSNSLWATWNPNATWVDVKVGDFNGEGMSDIAGRVLQSGQWWVGSSNGTSFSTSLWATWNPNVTWVDVQVGNFNSLGMSSIVGRILQSGQWWVGASNGASFANSLWATWNPNATWVDVQVGDFNGDGLSDITGRVLQNGQWWSGISNGAAFGTSLWNTWNPAANWINVHAGNFAW
jgi:hypothetical protein